jgi:hypothetical protein
MRGCRGAGSLPGCGLRQRCLLPDQKCWLGTGNFDADGHNVGLRLADQIPHGLDDPRDQGLRIARPS